MTRDELIGFLKEGEVEVCFKKKDGTERIMKCTLDPSYIPHTSVLGEFVEKKPRRKNENIVSVYDVELEEWRSFRFDSIYFVAVPQEDGKSTNLYSFTGVNR